MEAYYKDRQKQQSLYSKKIKKMTETKDPDVTRVKNEFIKWSLKTPTYDRGEYWPENEVIKELTKRIREAEEEFITLKYDLCYDLSSDLSKYEQLEKNIAKIKKTRERMLIEKQKREAANEKNKKDIKDQLKGLLDTYRYLEPEDKKSRYLEINDLSSKLVNPLSKVIAYEIEHSELEYRLTQLYEPLHLIKIS